jgi:ABC-type amino acid transport substrate-binding protein
MKQRDSEVAIIKFRGVFCGLSLVFIALLAYPQSPYELKTEFQDVPPKFVQDGEGYSGISYEVMRLIESKSLYAFTFDKRLVSIARVTRNLSNGVTDIQFGLQKTPEREKTMVYGPSLYTVRIVGVVRIDDNATAASLMELIREKATILTQSGTATAEWLHNIPGIIIDDGARTPEANLEKILTGRGTILIYHDLTVNHILKKPKYAGKFRRVELDVDSVRGLGSENQYVVYSRKVPKEIREDINRIIEEARMSGELSAITDKYFH